MSNRIRVVISDDHESVLDGITLCLTSEADLEVVGAASSAKDTFDIITELKPDLLIQDVQLPDISPIMLFQKLTTEFPWLKILALSASSVRLLQTIFRDYKLRGFLSKEDTKEDIITGVRWCASDENGFWISPKTARTFVLPQQVTPNQAGLSESELRIVALLNRTNSEISSQLGLSVGTVKNYVTSIYEKLGVNSREEAIRSARDLGLLH